MGQYIHFTEDQKLRAGSVDLEEFLRLRGEKLLSSRIASTAALFRGTSRLLVLV